MSNKKHFFVGDGAPKEERVPISTPSGEVPGHTPGIDVKIAVVEVDPNWDKEKKMWLVLPEPRMEPAEDRFLILPDPAMDRTESGIIITEAYKDKHVPLRGTVIAAGPGKDLGGSGMLVKIYKLLCKVFKQEYDLHGSMPYKRGDRVMYGHYAGVPVVDPDDEKKVYLIMRLNDVFIKL
jgi:co-chaperonin GroES (HSP10)